MKKRWRRWVILGIFSAILTVGTVSETRYTVNAKEEQHGEENEGETTDYNEGSREDSEASQITLTPSEPAADNGIRDVWGYYNQDSKVSVDVFIEEEDEGSGIQKIEYWITDGTEADGEEVERQTLYEYAASVDSGETEKAKMPENSADGSENGESNSDEECGNEEGNAAGDEMNTVDEDGDENQEETAPLLCWTGTVPVDTAVYHTCDVAVYVKATDCSGNDSVSVVRLDIDTVPPQILLAFDNNGSVSTDSAGNTYFNKPRTATVVITERTEHFDGESAVSGIEITAKNALGEDVNVNLNDMIGAWVTLESDTADGATHTAKITFADDANYTFSVAYKDAAGNDGTASAADGTTAPYRFTVDTTAPAGVLTAVTAEGEALSWDALAGGSLSFSLQSGKSITVSGVSEDMTSPVRSVCYYKTDNTKALSEQELRALDEAQWNPFSGFTISSEESFAVYERIVDMAGNAVYIGTEGMTVDSTAPKVEELTPKPVFSSGQSDSGIYSGDVRVHIRVDDGYGEMSGSGLKEITWRVLNAGEETQSGTLFLCDNANLTAADLSYDWEGNLTVDAEKNNSNEVTVEVYAMDNAGNTVAGRTELQIDISEPDVSVTGVEDGHAYKGDVVPEITFSDINFDSYEILLTRTDMYEIDEDVTDRFIGEISLTETGGSGICDTFEKVAENDGIYKLSVTVSDLAGNQSKTEIRFSVNRFGSVYVFSDYLVSLIQDGGAYVQSVASDLVITEYNADPLLEDSLSVEITRDGRPVGDAVYGLSMRAGEGDNTEGSGWYRYKYTIDKDNFTTEGIYKIVVSSEDAAGNLPENTNYEDQFILFRVDRTAPEITLITGLEESVVYGQTAEVTYTVYDTIGLKSVQAYVNGEAVGKAVTDFAGDNNNYTGILTLTADAEPQTIRLVAIDLAGNVTDTADRSAAGIAPFQETVTVTDEDDTAGLFNWFHRRSDGESDSAVQSQTGRIGKMAVCVAAVGACAAVLLWFAVRRVRKLSEKKGGKS